MSRSEMDLQAIREKLLRQSQQYKASTVNAASVDWSQARSSHGAKAASSPIPLSPSPASQQLANAVETLQQRSAQPVQAAQPVQFLAQAAQPAQSPALRQSTTLQPPSWKIEAAAQVSLHQQRLQTIVEQINDLSMRQERAMVEMKAVAERLDMEQRRQQRIEADQGLATSIPLVVNYDGALVASAEQDDLGNVVLTYRSVDLHQAHREAIHLAQALRDRNQVRNQQPSAFAHSPGIYTLLAEPLGAVRTLWELGSALAIEGFYRIAQLVNEVRSQESTPFTLTDGIIWFGGGVIGRLALNLLLSAYPGLWSLAVAGAIGMTAYALYRATLAPRIQIDLAYRVLLAVAGLIIGGRF